MLKMTLKKAARTAQILAPSLQEARFAIHRKTLSVLKIPWRPDSLGLNYFRKENLTIVDVGANRGFSIETFLMLKPRSRIVAFEPISHLAAILQKRYEKNANVVVHCLALGENQGEATLFIPIYSGFIFDPLASLHFDEAAEWINRDRVFFFNPDKLRIREETVSIRRLDDLDLKPDVIKLYAQGHEPEVIFGGLQTIRKFEPAIMAPARIPRVDTCLKQLGYSRFAFIKSKFVLEAEGHTSSWYLKEKHLSLT